MKGPIIGIVIVLALLATGAIFFAEGALTPPAEAPTEQTYANDLFGISFSYPVGYILAESEVGALGRTHHVITIITEEDAVPRVNSEGPTAITFDIYQNDNDDISLEKWLQTDESNLQLGNGKSEFVTVDGAEAVQYSWSGLYEGETTAFLHDEHIIAVSVTYFSKSDQLYSDYQTLLQAIRLR